MSFQAYLDTIKAKTGKTPDDFRALAAQKGLTQYSEVVAWLKNDFGLGQGHANAMAQLLVNAEKFTSKPEDKLAAHFAGDKARWRAAYDDIAAQINAFGADIAFSPNSSYINVQRGGKKFAILQPSTPERFDIGIKLKGAAPDARFEASGSWNAMVTHRVRISDPRQIDAEVLDWLKRAYEAAS
jgi:hypothetical protein